MAIMTILAIVTVMVIVTLLVIETIMIVLAIKCKKKELWFLKSSFKNCQPKLVHSESPKVLLSKVIYQKFLNIKRKKLILE